MNKAQGANGPEDRENPKGQTSDLEARIRRAKHERPGFFSARRAKQDEWSGTGRGFRLASEFVAAIIVGAGIGLGIDSLFGTTPWGLIVLILVGFAAGVLNVTRAASELNSEAAKFSETGAPPEDDDE
jgi:ATP synthase protein I